MTRAPLDLIQSLNGVHESMTGHDAAISALRPASGDEAQLVPLTQAGLIAAETVNVPVDRLRPLQEATCLDHAS